MSCFRVNISNKNITDNTLQFIVLKFHWLTNKHEYSALFSSSGKRKTDDDDSTQTQNLEMARGHYSW